jgi:putative transposase
LGDGIRVDGFAPVVKTPEGTQGFVLLPKGWTVERTYGWFHCSGRRNIDYQRLPASKKGFIHIAMIRQMVSRFA